jgi:hypothetical protein
VGSRRTLGGMETTASSVRRGRVRLAVVLVAALAVAAALAPATVSAAPSKCSYPALTTPFTPWSDPATYSLVVGGSFEQSGNAAWSLAGAKIVPGNEPFYVHASSDSRSLNLPDLSTATTPTICTSDATPSIRVFATNDGDPASVLTVDLGIVTKGITWSRIATLVAPAPGWVPSPVIMLNLPPSAFVSGTAKVVFRFTAQGGGAGGAWRIDDLYLDPFKRV